MEPSLENMNVDYEEAVALARAYLDEDEVTVGEWEALCGMFPQDVAMIVRDQYEKINDYEHGPQTVSARAYEDLAELVRIVLKANDRNDAVALFRAIRALKLHLYPKLAGTL